MRRLLCFLFHYPRRYVQISKRSPHHWWCYRCHRHRTLGKPLIS